MKSIGYFNKNLEMCLQRWTDFLQGETNFISPNAGWRYLLQSDKVRGHYCWDSGFKICSFCGWTMGCLTSFEFKLLHFSDWVKNVIFFRNMRKETFSNVSVIDTFKWNSFSSSPVFTTMLWFIFCMKLFSVSWGLSFMFCIYQNVFWHLDIQYSMWWPNPVPLSMIHSPGKCPYLVENAAENNLGVLVNSKMTIHVSPKNALPAKTVNRMFICIRKKIALKRSWGVIIPLHSILVRPQLGYGMLYVVLIPQFQRDDKNQKRYIRDPTRWSDVWRHVKEGRKNLFCSSKRREGLGIIAFQNLKGNYRNDRPTLHKDACWWDKRQWVQIASALISIWK